MRKLRTSSILITCLALVACKIEITVPDGGRVVSESGTYECSAGQVCLIDVRDVFFNEEFTVNPHPGWRFRWWKSRPGYFCGGKTSNCVLSTAAFEGNDILMGLLDSDEVFFLEPVFSQESVDTIGQHYASSIVLIPRESEDHFLPSSVTAVDVNGDGKDDVVFGALREDTEASAPIQILTANEAGLLELSTKVVIEGVIPETGRGPRQIIPGDFNGDGELDLFLESHGSEPDCGDGSVTCWEGGQNALLLATGNGTLKNVTNSHLPAFSDFSHGSSILDYDGDGDIDIWVNNLCGSDLYNPCFRYLLQNDGAGRFSVVADMSVAEYGETPITGKNGILPKGSYGGGGWSVAIDANGDGHMDLQLTRAGDVNGGVEIYQNLLLINNGAAQFEIFPGDSWPSMGCDASPNRPDPEACSQDEDPGTEHALVYDLNRDGLDDMLLYQTLVFMDKKPQRHLIQILISNGDGTFRDETRARYRGWPVAILSEFQLHDLDGDGYKDLFSNVDYSENDIRLNDGEGFFRRLDADWVRTEGSWEVLDVDGDGGTDFFIDGWQGYQLAKMSLTYGPNLTGTPDDDRLIGGAHNNVFKGLAGWDFLDGGLGADRLVGGLGNNTLKGGKGPDTYVFEAADLAGHDTVIDKLGNDKLEFSGFGLGEVTAVRQGKNGRLILEFATGGSITVRNHFSKIEYAIETIMVGQEEFSISNDPEFEGGSIEELLGI